MGRKGLYVLRGAEVLRPSALVDRQYGGIGSKGVGWISTRRGFMNMKKSDA